MQATGIIDSLPLWALYLITAALVLLSAEAGWRLGDFRRHLPRHEKDAPSRRGGRLDARPAGLPAGIHVRDGGIPL